MKRPPTRRAGGPMTGNPGGPITLAKSAHAGPMLLAGDTFDRTGAEHPAALVAVEHGMICGFVITGLSHDSDLQDARELWAIYVDPQRWGNGIGRSSWRLPEIGFLQ